MNPSSFQLDQLRENIRPFRLHWFPTLRSTNDHAAALRKRGDLFAPAIVLTGRQTAGRGRTGQTWWSATGCLTVTFAFPIEDHLLVHQLPLLAGLAVRNAAAELTAQSPITLKWPNDLLHHGRKLAGLLCERIHRVDLIGLGMNINLDPHAAPPPLRNNITSLAAIAKKPLDITHALTVIARHLRLMLLRQSHHPFPALLAEYDQHHALVGKTIKVTAPDGAHLVGQCQGLDNLGRLLLKNARQLHHLTTGHVQLLDK